VNHEERICCFDCHGERLYGILSLPAIAQTGALPGVLMLVGGAQYRAGSHRQFALLARYFADNGIAVLRFDYRGMGDSEGDARNFEQIGDDIGCAIDAFMQAVPQMSGVVLWGLCDGASAALLYGATDARVSALSLVNPWARTDAGLAQTYLKHYYASHLLSKALWSKILRGQFNPVAAATSFATQLRRAFQRRHGNALQAAPSLPDRLRLGYQEFTGPIQLVLCGNDLTAQEFADLATADRRWHVLLHDHRTERLELPLANHTFSTQAWRDQLAAATLRWLQSLPQQHNLRH